MSHYGRITARGGGVASWGGAMYPPIYRQAERRKLNDDALDKMVDIVKTRGNVLGMHPEGTRGKGDDPYTFLPAQPGVGKLALVAQPVVVPAFILGGRMLIPGAQDPEVFIRVIETKVLAAAA